MQEWEPEEGEELSADDPRVRLFPDPSSVFVDDQPWLADVVEPVLLVDLAALDPALSGWLPVVDPIEPADGVQGSVGDETEESHDEHAGDSWMALRWEPDGRLRFLGRRTFFLREALRERGEWHGSAVEAHYRRDVRDRAAVKERLAGAGGRSVGRAAGFLRRRRSVRETEVFTLGGDLYEGNWTVVAPPAAYRYVEPSDHGGPPRVTTADGRDFRLVGLTPRWAWADEAVAQLLVLFEPETRTVLVALEF